MPLSEYHTEHTVNGQPAWFSSSLSPYETRSEEVQDIMSTVPRWIIRRGTGMLCGVMILLFTGAYFIHYPDVIVASVTITSSNPPVKIISQSSGKIQQMFVKNNESVEREAPICLQENSANYRDITSLKNVLSTLDTALELTQVLRTVSFNQHVQLGELQAGYTDLYQSVHQYLFFTGKNFITQKVGHLQSQIVYGSLISQELRNKDVLLKQQLALEKKRFIADSSLVVDKVIAPLEFDNSKKELINKQVNADATNTSILQNKLQQAEYLKNITDLQQQKMQQENDLLQQIRENVKRLQGQLDLWEQKYLVKSPVAGKVVFFKFWKENQYVTNGETILVIVPPIQNYVARSLLPVNGAGKVKAGQKVLIKLIAYPFEEFGMLRGEVGAVSAVALDTSYSMEIILGNKLITTTNKKIPSQAQLSGVAEILTDNKSILERLLKKVKI